VRRRILHPKAKSNSRSLSVASASRETLFGEPLLLEGEDSAAYEQLSAQICATIRPIDIIERIFVDEIVSLQWDVLRWRRLKNNFIRVHGLNALEAFFLAEGVLEYSLYSEYLAEDLAEILQDNLPESHVDSAKTLAEDCAMKKPHAVDRVNEILTEIGTDLDRVANRAQARKAKEMVQEYRRREPAAVTLVDEILAGASTSMDALIAQAMAEQMDMVERCDRMTAIAESRRNASLHEIERRRALFGETMRRYTNEIEDAEFEEV
jgi:hypothetical protein